MRDSKDLEDQIHAVRYANHEEIKDMSPSEMTAYMRAQVAPLHKEFGYEPVTEPLLHKKESKVTAQG
jgi:hypothetical protein